MALVLPRIVSLGEHIDSLTGINDCHLTAMQFLQVISPIHSCWLIGVLPCCIPKIRLTTECDFPFIRVHVLSPHMRMGRPKTMSSPFRLLRPAVNADMVRVDLI